MTDDQGSSDISAAWLVHATVREVVDVSERIVQAEPTRPQPGRVCVDHIYKLSVQLVERRQGSTESLTKQR